MTNYEINPIEDVDKAHYVADAGKPFMDKSLRLDAKSERLNTVRQETDELKEKFHNVSTLRKLGSIPYLLLSTTDAYHPNEARASRELLIPPVEIVSKKIQELRLRHLGEKSMSMKQRAETAFDAAEKDYDTTDHSNES